MVFFNYALRKLNAKIVYYGPGLCGKTTNLVWIHDNFEGGDRGKMISLATEGDRTIFFDLLPLEIGSIRGMDVTLQLYTVPGQVHYNSTRQLVLRGADGVVFVADSQRAMQGSNTDSFKNLQENLLLQGISLDGFPHVLQFNKRDLRDVVPVEELNDELNHYSVPIFEATATDGVGVQETLEGIVKLVMRNLRQRYEGATTGSRTPGVEDSQVSIPDAPPTPPPGPAEVIPPEEPIAIADPPPAAEEPVAPPEEKPPTQEPVTPPEPEPEPAPDAPPPSSIIEPTTPIDPAKTVDFSQSMGADPFGGLGGGFEDEVSTAVYDSNEDSAIDFEELKRLDAKPGSPAAEPPPPAEPPPAEPPPVEPAAFGAVDPVAEVAPPEAVEQAPPAFDLDSTDAGAKTQDAAQERADEAMAGFDFGAEAPDMDSIPDFELDVPEPEPPPQPEPESEPEPVAEVAPPAAEVAPPDAVDVQPDVAPPPAFEPEVVEEPPAVAAEAAPVKGRYEDEINAPSPFAPNPDAPGGSTEALKALGALTGDEAPAVVPEEIEPPAVAAVEPEIAPPAEPEVLADFEVPKVPEMPEVAESADQFEAPAIIEVPEEMAVPPEPEVVDEVPEIEIIEDDLGAVQADLDELTSDIPLVEEAEAAPEVIDEELFDATPKEPVLVGDDDPWTEEELSGVYDLAEVEKAEQAAAIEAAEPSPVDVSAGDNQLHLRLKGTGAIVESGQVRALDIEVPVPGSWVGNRRVTLQLRLTLTPDTEFEDDGSDSSS